MNLFFFLGGGVINFTLMKKLIALIYCVIIISIIPLLTAQDALVPRVRPDDKAKPTPDVPSIVEKGAHHRVWRKAQVESMPGGWTRTNYTSHTELSSGMHRWDSRAGEWVEAEATIELLGEGAIGRNGAHSVGFAANANTAGAIDLVTPDGQRLRSHVLGLAFFEPRTGHSELFAALKDSVGELHPPNVVIYPDAFDGVKADLRYTYRLGGFEQDVILRENPILPQGFDAGSVLIEAWTEFVSAPEPTISSRHRVGMQDDTLNFGSMQAGPGQAFPLGSEDKSSSSTPVAKRWLHSDGRTFLVEAVRRTSVRKHLDKLPAAKEEARLIPEAAAGLPQQASLRPFPPAPVTKEARVGKPVEKFRMASIPRHNGQARDKVAEGAGNSINSATLTARSSTDQPHAGFVLDYNLTSGLSNFTFRCDTTYKVANTVTLFGTTTFEGGCVVKFEKPASASIILAGSVDWRTAPYRPAIFTAVDDHTVGEQIGNGNLSGYYGGAMLSFATSTNGTPSNLRISHASTGLKSGDTGLTLRNAQLVHCKTAIEDTYGSTSFTAENVLFYDIDTLHRGGAYMFGHHITVHQCTNFAAGMAGQAQLFNSLLIGLYSVGSASLTLNSSYKTTQDEPGVFQTLGGASHYLAPNSPHRNVGTINLSASLLKDIRQRTTYPPSLLTSQTIANLTTLWPQVQRDVDAPDRGYHYAPLDFVLGATLLTHTLDVKAGTAFGISAPGTTYGVQLQGGQLLGTGTPMAPIHFARCQAVQEQANASWSGRGPMLRVSGESSATPSLARLRFTEFSSLAGDKLLEDYAEHDSDFSFVDSCLRGGKLDMFRAWLHFTNSLLDRVGGWVESINYDSVFDARHCLFREVQFTAFYQYGNIPWTLTDNLFDNSNLNPDGDVTHSYNAYTINSANNCTRPLPTAGNGNVFLAVTNFTYQRGLLGDFLLRDFYQPATSPLLNVGSALAASAGLYHYTTTTNQVKEATTQADIGLHYVALNGSSLPIDTDGDGGPDYYEDHNGNGVCDEGELHFLRRITPGNQFRDDIMMDQTPPSLIVDYPSTTAVSQPTIQIRGHSPEDLKEVSVQVNGTTRNTYILNRNYDRSTSRVTTNRFQAFDVTLQPGPNNVSISATDLAGNPAVKQFTVVLDLAGDHTPPAITHHFPLRGSVTAGQAAISGNKFTLRGQLDDPTASVSAQILTGPHAGRYNGIVERDGVFWVDNLPLTAVSQDLLLEARDVAGNASTSSITVEKSSVELTMVPDEGWNGDRVKKVSGTITATTLEFKVWVNGKAAEILNPAGAGPVWNWEVENVPLNEGGTAILQALAIPLAANGGNGGIAPPPLVGGLVTVASMGNPFDLSAQGLEMLIERPHVIRIRSINESVAARPHRSDEPCDLTTASWHWARGQPGDATCQNAHVRELGGVGQLYPWGDWERHWNDEGHITVDRQRTFVNWFVDCSKDAWETLSPAPVTRPPQKPTQFAEVHFVSDYDPDKYYTESTQTLLEIQTGGRALIGQTMLFKVTPSASLRSVSEDGSDELVGGFENCHNTEFATLVDPPSYIAPHLLEVLGQSPPPPLPAPEVSKNYFYISLPGNTLLDCTVTTTASQFYDFAVSAVRCDPDVLLDSNNTYLPLGTIASDPAERAYEDAIEAIQGNHRLPGRIVKSNTGDVNEDGVPDFADGIWELGTEGVGASHSFVPVNLQLSIVDSSIAKLKFRYNGSDPTLLQSSMPTPALPSGAIRLWLKDGYESRSIEEDYLEPEKEYPASMFDGNSWFYVEGLRPSSGPGDVLVEVLVDPSGDDGFIGSDAFSVIVLGADLDVDSNNNNGLSTPDREADEDAMEDHAPQPGKILRIHRDDSDGDGIPGYADDLIAADAHFAPLVLEFAKGLDLPGAKIKITYNASDPSTVIYDDSGDSPEWQPGPGKLRIWRKDANAARNKNSANGINTQGHAVSAGDYVAPGLYKLSELGYSAAQPSVTFFMEGIAAGSDQVVVEYIYDGLDYQGPRYPIRLDAVRVLVLDEKLLVDLSRNGEILANSSDISTPEHPWRFWVNDDLDHGDVGGGDSNLPGQIGAPNSIDAQVNGRMDLIDFFPLALDLYVALQELPPSDGYEYRLTHEDGSVNFVYTDLQRTDALQYLTNPDSYSYGVAFNKRAFEADTIHISASHGIVLEQEFLSRILANGLKGVLLIEARNASSKPLFLEIWHHGRKWTEMPLYLSLSGVESMYRWINLRQAFAVAGETQPAIDRASDSSSQQPSNFPDLESNEKQLIYLHGFNVSERQSRSEISEAFKRLWQSGSRAMFTGVSWYGSQGATTPVYGARLDYYSNVRNAFLTAPHLKNAVAELPGTHKFITAHSLGNMVVSSAIVDHNMSVEKYFALEAAVPMEAYSGTIEHLSMVNPTESLSFYGWINYDRRLWASDWNKLFSPANGFADDGRYSLTWRDRFGAIPNMYNFHSTGEEVLKNSQGTVPSPGVEYIWVYQEMKKGSGLLDALAFFGLIDSHPQAGWDINYAWFVLQPGGPLAPGGSLLPRAPAQATPSDLTDAALRSEPFFRRFRDNRLTDPVLGSDAAREMQVRAEVLGTGIPALSYATGANQLAAIGVLRNFDLNSLNSNNGFQTGWPASRLANPDESTRWLHSDLKDVAYPYNHKMHDKIVDLGGLRNDN